MEGSSEPVADARMEALLSAAVTAGRVAASVDVLTRRENPLPDLHPKRRDFYRGL
jgi:hypothetical protein